MRVKPDVRDGFVFGGTALVGLGLGLAIGWGWGLAAMGLVLLYIAR